MGVLDDRTRMLVEEVYGRQAFNLNLIKDIRDPEKPQTLEELSVVSEEEISVSTDRDAYRLCVRTKLEENLPYSFKLDIFIKEGSHTTAAELSKQINDKERVAAAMENKNIKDMVQSCISYETM
ncbi:cytosolic iron-sulfur assembly component galla-1 isoform X3 [Rhipicephalus microplus]|uniref:cytosolic iron-sulfur assembly component galla-1 isoform X3 n=1 Tax=Rhipicephalus microplus TaxID=6941 RepID=UPI003F6CFD47